MISTQFIQSCQSGDESAIRTLVQTYQRSVYQLALSIIDSSDASDPSSEAEIATRDTFIAAVDRIGRYREGSSFETWLFGIAIRVSQRRARSWRARRSAARLLHATWRGVIQKLSTLTKSVEKSDAEPGAAAPAQSAARTPADKPRLQPVDDELWASVRRLDEKLRVPVVLRYYHDYPIDEIAHLLHISEGTVHARLDAAREKIAHRLETKPSTAPSSQ